MHLPTLIAIILLLNLVLGGLLLVIYRLRLKQRCFLYWAISCWVFVIGGLLAAARNYIEAILLTHWLASLLLIIAPLLAVKGVQHFRARRSAKSWQLQVRFVLIMAIMLAALVPIFAWMAPFTSLIIAGLFAWALYLLVNIKASTQLPQRLLSLFFALHILTMLLQAGAMAMSLITAPAALTAAELDTGIVASTVSSSAGFNLDLMLHTTFISHLLLTTTTALMFPLLVFSKTEERLVELANIDDLTRLSNRRAFFLQADKAFAQAKIEGSPVCVLMVDLDYFKDVNDTWGHAIGDECLRWVANELKQALRDTDIIARVGGEEFAIALPGVTSTAAKNLSKRLCKNISENPLEIDNHTISLSVSIGGVLRNAQHLDFHSLLSDADKALYQAKENGRNQAVFI
ncbi:hypothetical protein CWE08_01015 [Aliidiomarina iranensis]|uniref:GGDEF domain-containing protein n=1 Tax=Aliidiomarina iranensis TaxID=1434071 RepID=A0A432W211_9GAMM|nr:GGDEF domain-containing protein [Aliidiomarina iranensis]RUO23264.1 hypothetical protein CWE08_01015 [Aliidiomarina iranensis]